VDSEKPSTGHKRTAVVFGSAVVTTGITLAVGAALALLAAHYLLAEAFAVLLPDAQRSWWIPAAGLLLLVIATVGHRTGHLRLTAAVAVAVMALGAMALLQTNTGIGTDPLRVRLPTNVLGRWVASERLTQTTAVLFLYLACPFLAAPWIRHSSQRAVALTTAGIVAVLGAGSCLVGELVTIFGLTGFNPLQGLGVSTGLGFLGVGAAMVGTGVRHRATPGPEDSTFDSRAAGPIVGLALAALLSATLIAFQWADGERAAHVRARFETAAGDIVDDIGERMPTYVMVLRGGADFLERTAQISRRDWSAYIRSLRVVSTFPGLVGIGYVAYVPNSETAAHLAQMQEQWSADYKIFPRTGRADHAPVVLLEPITDQNRQAIGFDHLSEASRRTAIYAVRDSGEPSVSGTLVISLNVAKPPQFGFLMYMPVYAHGRERTTEAQRRKAFAGAVFAPFRFDELLHGILLDRYKGVRVRVLDGDPDLGARMVFDSQREADGSLWQSVPFDTLPVGVLMLGHRWTVLATPQRAFVAAEPGVSAWILLGAGTLISLLFAAGIWQLFAVQSRERSLAEAQGLNSEIESRLKAEQDLQATREETRQRVEALNQELVKRATALEVANRDLGAFSYSVSHDLKQPVSAIAAFASLALEESPSGMNPHVQELVTRIEASSYRMSEIIDGLLDLSSVAQRELRSEAVDLGNLAQETIKELRAANPGRNVEVVIAAGLTTSGDPILLRVLVNNLIGNAWKYSGKTLNARIEMGAADTPRGRAYFVNDNGAGFAMAKADRLFTVFHRLHAASDFPGTGIGLATVYRIVDRHGGQIWAESQPGQGAHFYFTLNAAGSAPPGQATDRTS
jgi:signal transduction histidine kinase